MTGFFEPTPWHPAQIKALADLSELHPGEDLRLDHCGNRGDFGMVIVFTDESSYVITEKGELRDNRGVPIGPEAVAS